MGTSKPRIITTIFYSKHIKLNVIQYYAPTTYASDDKKDEFYQALNEYNRKDTEPQHGYHASSDMNAKTTRENKDHEETMSRKYCGKRNENGHLCLDYCLSNNLTVGGSVFPHTNIHK